MNVFDKLDKTIEKIVPKLDPKKEILLACYGKIEEGVKGVYIVKDIHTYVTAITAVLESMVPENNKYDSDIDFSFGGLIGVIDEYHACFSADDAAEAGEEYKGRFVLALDRGSNPLTKCDDEAVDGAETDEKVMNAAEYILKTTQDAEKKMKAQKETQKKFRSLTNLLNDIESQVNENEDALFFVYGSLDQKEVLIGGSMMNLLFLVASSIETIVPEYDAKDVDNPNVFSYGEVLGSIVDMHIKHCIEGVQNQRTVLVSDAHLN